jgi:hypothetical protein
MQHTFAQPLIAPIHSEDCGHLCPVKITQLQYHEKAGLEGCLHQCCTQCRLKAVPFIPADGNAAAKQRWLSAALRPARWCLLPPAATKASHSPAQAAAPCCSTHLLLLLLPVLPILVRLPAGALQCCCCLLPVTQAVVLSSALAHRTELIPLPVQLGQYLLRPAAAGGGACRNTCPTGLPQPVAAANKVPRHQL